MSQISISKRNIKEDSLSDQDYPDLDLHSEKVLIVVKTSPNPSKNYRETVCTAGITEKGKWIRLYPVQFRYMDFFRQYKKYQWIKVNIEKQPRKTDFRKDSYRPDIRSIVPIGKELDTKNNWSKRKEIVLPTLSPHMEDIFENYAKNGISLGVIKPKTIEKFIIEADDSDWGPKQKQILLQQTLFDPPPKDLEKIPYKFSYKFRCDNVECRGHEMQIIDWELSELYRGLRLRFPLDPDVVLEKIKDKWYYEMCGGNKDTYFFVGSIYPNPSFVVLGVFWPSKPEGEYELGKIQERNEMPKV